MPGPVGDQVIDFYSALFDRIFSEPFQVRVSERLKRNAVVRQVGESADAASQSLTRFFLNEQQTEQQAAEVLGSLRSLVERLRLEDISNPNVTPESVVESMLAEVPIPVAVSQTSEGAVLRVALHLVVQVLMLVGPVMAEWQRLGFATTFEMPRRVVDRLNQISSQLGALGRSGQAAADERYELTYRDYLLQRFHRVEAGTVRMTTSLDVDLRELFVMPSVQVTPPDERTAKAKADDRSGFMDLAAARKFLAAFDQNSRDAKPAKAAPKSVLALAQVKKCPKNVIVGAPGSGKSTFFEWLQLKLASADEEFVLTGKQAIPLLLRVRQLDPKNLPKGMALIEKATASRDRAVIMPADWIERQMKGGRVIFMLDGLDETEPDLRDEYILPWVEHLCSEFPQCHFLISSRPVGYPPGTLSKLGFAECRLLDFEDPQIVEFTRHWCTAVRLARNEPGDEARREGESEGKRIVEGFKSHPYIRNLARNPLMLSAICLVNYFEHGQLPQDRALLYRLCVEGLLHYWDQRRGIHSEFTLDEKLRVCREVALAMQANDRAEYEAESVRKILAEVLGDESCASRLLEHIRYRTGLLLERRSGVFGFAHLTFQEYLAACAVHEGNRMKIDATTLAKQHADPRWKEVIALYCGLAPSPAARSMIEALIAEADTRALADVLAEAFISSRPELAQDTIFKRKVLERIAVSPAHDDPKHPLSRFSSDEVAEIANQGVGFIRSDHLSESFRWLQHNRKRIDFSEILTRLRKWRSLSPFQNAELVYLVPYIADVRTLAEVAKDTDLYKAPGPIYEAEQYLSQAELALIGLQSRDSPLDLRQLDEVILPIFRAIASKSSTLIPVTAYVLSRILSRRTAGSLPSRRDALEEFTLLVPRLLKLLAKTPQVSFWGWNDLRRVTTETTNWTDALKRAIVEQQRPPVAQRAEDRSTRPRKRPRQVRRTK